MKLWSKHLMHRITNKKQSLISLPLPNIQQKLKQRNEEQCGDGLKQCLFEGDEEAVETEFVEIENYQTMHEHRQSCVGKKPGPAEVGNARLQARFVVALRYNGTKQQWAHKADKR